MKQKILFNESKAKEMRNLVDRLNQCRDSYYNNNESIISDREYDSLFDKLLNMEAETGIVYTDSPTATVGYESVSKLNKVKHNHPLLSLGKTTDIKEFANYFMGHDVCLMAKMDGLTVSLRYENGKLVSGESRGNGEIGEDITHNANVFVNLPKEIPFDGELIVDGECIIDYDTFDKINETEGTEYKNPRNLVSGTVRQLESKIVASRGVRFIAWKLYSAKGADGSELRHTEKYTFGFQFLRMLGFEVVPYYVAAGDAEHLYSIINVLKKECSAMRYPIDGIVGAFNDVRYGNSLGSTSHHPKHSLAFKFYQEENETTLTDIEWNTTRTGMVNPVAVFEPIEIDGTTVSRASLSNVSVLRELELGIGDTITVIKANQIIPKITGNLTRSDSYKLPVRCPSCGDVLFLDQEVDRDVLYCINNNCVGVKCDRLSHFASREGMNIVGLSGEKIKALVNNGFLTDFESIYSLKNHADEVSKLGGFGEASVKKLLDAIEESKHRKFSNVLIAIGIPYVGKSAAKQISQYCTTHTNGLDNIFVNFLILAHKNHDWTTLDNFGYTMSKNINNYVKLNGTALLSLAKTLYIEGDGVACLADGKLLGKTFCITGKLFKYKNRNELISVIENCGGKVVGSVTEKTDYLITNEPDSGSSKNQKAKIFGTKIITEDEFSSMCME